MTTVGKRIGMSMSMGLKTGMSDMHWYGHIVGKNVSSHTLYMLTTLHTHYVDTVLRRLV